MSQSKHNKSEVFTRPKGTVNKGNSFEPCNIANIVLNLVSDKNVRNFYISSNDNQYGAFDDIVVTVDFNNTEKSSQHALQLKHNDRGQLTEDRLKGQKDFSINKYYESWKKIKRDVQNFILFTNLKFGVNEDVDLVIGGEKFLLRPKNVKDEAVKFINTSDSENCCFRFEIVNGTTNQQFQDFLDKFYLYVSQQNLDGIKKQSAKRFKEMFSSDEFDKFFKVISEWSMEEGKTEKLDKEWMRNAIAIHSLSSKIKPLSFRDVNEEMKILREAIGSFDFTLLEKESSYETVKELWGDIKSSFKDTKEINTIIRKYQLDPNFIEDFDKTDSQLSSKLLWLMGKCPLIVTKDETVEKVVGICERNKFVVIDENLDRGWLKSPPFQNLSDLKEKNPNKFGQVLRKFYCSLQGKNVNLEKLLHGNEKFLDSVTTDDLLEMLKGTLNMGGEKEILCEPYVDRFLSRNIIDIQFLENIEDKTVIVIDCVENVNDLKQKFPRHDFVNVDDYLNGKSEKKMKSDINGTRATIFFSQNKCDVFKFQQVYAKNENKKIGHHFRLENDNLEWIRSKGDVGGLEKYKILDKFFIPENTLFSSEPENNINVIIGDAGMGKTELMKSLKNNCSDTLWTIIMYPKDIVSLCQNLESNTSNDESVEKLIFDIKCKSFKAKDQNLFGSLGKQKKVMYVWEALDEISSEQLEKVTDIINEFSKKGFIQWITSRYNLKNFLEKNFGALAITINKFNEQEQHSYIYDRLKHHCDPDKIEKIIDKLKSTFVLIEHVDILGIPLQLYMLTELFLQNIDGYLEKFSNTFVLTDLYYHFVEEKFNVYFREKLTFDMHNPGTARLIKFHKLEALKYFQVMSMKTLLPEDIIKQLNLNYETCVQQSEDYISIGVITEINNDIPRFIHGSFAEYFVALYFSENLQSNKIMSVMKLSIFDEKYNNVRFFFDLMLAKNSKEECSGHVAFLYKNFDSLRNFDRKILTRRDIGGRTVLHLASSWGQRCPILRLIETQRTFTVCNANVRNLKAENAKFQQLFLFLLEVCEGGEIDSLFNMDCLSYAEKSNCVFARIKLMHHQKLIVNESNKNAVLLYYSASFGYDDALELFDSKSHRHRFIFDTRNLYGESVLFIASRNGHEKIVEFLLANDADINIANAACTTPLRIASQNGHVKIVELLVAKGAVVNLADKDGWTPLHVASLHGYNNIIEVLLENGAKINLGNKDDFTALHAASQNGHEKIVELLVAKGAEINLANKDGSTPLYTASLNGDEKIVQLLVAKGGQINLGTKDGFTALHTASQNGHVKIVELLVAKGGQINLTNEDGFAPIHTASLTGHEKIVEFLVAKGAEINLANKNGWTPLFVASVEGHEKIVELLVEKGADINLAEKNGRTPLFTASENGHEKIVEFLVAKGAEVNLATIDDGFTPLYIAFHKGHEKIVEFLIAKSAEINLAEKFGYTPLHAASLNGHEKIVELLVAKGGQIDFASTDGFTALHAASHDGHEKIVEFLMAQRAKINIADKDGSTPLHLASQNGHEKIVELLVAKGAEINLADKNGWTPLYIASENGYDEIVEILVAKNVQISSINNNK